MILNSLLVITFFSIFILIKKIITNYVKNQATQKEVSDSRANFISLSLNTLVFMVLFSVLLNLLNLGYGDISLFISSIFAVLGVALIAQWSMLSNITASVLIFFVFPYRIGDRIKVESDEMIGVIRHIGMFHLSIQRDDGNIILYPNNLILQKAVIKLINKEKKVKIHRAVKINRPPLAPHRRV